ncbi:hypothetical protein THAOC_14822 [Thalassiosira oceanica]|uniref:Sel1 repeat family protein n=1 Tax=Thalassiosira oceanica TaxID=159749 RepID=K0SE77_THAOC|nr:hypothetical protein THAOC_14822 [Thalassiosira oceanica]|eukprot:EJK64443.1 hypothetical protein THAOC_14822 [Thalassiosira oceanica]
MEDGDGRTRLRRGTGRDAPTTGGREKTKRPVRPPSGVSHQHAVRARPSKACHTHSAARGEDVDLRRVRTRAAGGLVRRGTAGTQAEHQEMRRVRRRGESAGAHEEGPHEVGGGRLPDLPVASAPRWKAVQVQARKRGMNDCPFCRAPRPKKSQIVSMVEKRVDAGDPVAMWHLGNHYSYGLHGLEKDVTRAIELYERAAVLGSKHAQMNLGCLYHVGADVEQDTAKALRHLEAAAVKGDILARFTIGTIEANAGNYDIALQHWMISAKMGHQGSLNNIKNMFVNGHATKADYAEALRGYHSAAEEMRSPDREEALALVERTNDRLPRYEE